MSAPPGLPILPSDELTVSELIPFRSRKVNFLKSRALIPLVFTASMVVLLFSRAVAISSYDDIFQYMVYVAYLVCGIMFMMIYYYTGERKFILWYAVPLAFTWWWFYKGFNYYAYLFREVLPGDYEHVGPGFLAHFWAYFFAAGLTEETFKATPIVLALILAIAIRHKPEWSNSVTRGLALEGPVDGMLIGAAVGIAFTLNETLGQYVPNIIREIAAANQGNKGMGMAMGFVLLLPRIAGGIVGHTAYAAIFGYFAGLAVTHPKAIWKLLIIGLLAAAIPHTLWDSLDTLLPSPYGMIVSAAIVIAMFLACLLKAKQLEVSRLGGPVDGRSILAISPPPGTLARGPAGVVPPPATGIAGLFTGIATAVERAVGFKATTTVPAPGSSAAAAAAVPRISVGSSTARYALAPNATIDFSALFAAASVPPGCQGTVVLSADGGFDLVNSGSGTWTATTPQGSAASVVPSGRLRGEAGTRLMLGPATLTLDAY